MEPSEKKPHWWQSHPELWQLESRISDVEKKIEQNVRFNGLPRWQRILDGAIMWMFAFILWMAAMSFISRIAPILLPLPR